MTTESDSYSREELLEADGLPERGDLCHQCGVRVPRFAEMDDDLRRRLFYLIDRQRGIMAVRELQSKLGCSHSFAKIWVTHRGKGKPRYPGSPCPYCGKPLRTSRAKQCPHCLEAWHHREPPPRQPKVHLDVADAVAEISDYEGDADRFDLAIADSLLDPAGVHMAIILDAVLAKGWTVDGYEQMDGYRIYRYKDAD